MTPKPYFEMSNLQALWEECNLGKSNRDDTTFVALTDEKSHAES